MANRIIVLLTILILLGMVYRWTKRKTDNSKYDDYAIGKPPLYVYFNTSGIEMPMVVYFVVAAVVSGLSAMIFHRFSNNPIGSMLIAFIVMQFFKQNVIVRSIRNSQAIDYSAPGYLTFFGSIMRLHDNPTFALKQSAKYASPRYRKILETLQTRLENGKDPLTEIDRAKQYFRNRIFRNFLDDIGDHITKGNVLNATITRLIERANDRKGYTAERKIETFAAVFVIYGGIAFEAVTVLFVSLFKPSLLDVFVNSSIGQFAVWIIIAITGCMLTIVNRLILFSEG